MAEPIIVSDSNQSDLRYSMENPKFIELESKIDALIEVCEELQRENEMLKSTQGTWHKERAQLREKNEQARTRVEAMIARLKSLEKEV